MDSILERRQCEDPENQPQTTKKNKRISAQPEQKYRPSHCAESGQNERSIKEKMVSLKWRGWGLIGRKTQFPTDSTEEGLIRGTRLLF